jgi:hypothetical protein
LCSCSSRTADPIGSHKKKSNERGRYLIDLHDCFPVRVPSTIRSPKSKSEEEKNENRQRASAGRLGAEIVWGPAPPAITWLARSARSLARPRRPAGLQRQLRPLLFSPNFELVKKKKRGRACPRRTYIKKRDKLLCPFRITVALPCVSGVVYLCRDMFFCRFLFRDSVLPLCPHSVLSTQV